jgi:hypothetical protein
MESRRMRWERYLITHECDEKILVRKSERKRNNLEDLGVHGRTVVY